MNTENQAACRLIRLPQIIEITGMKKASIYLWMKEGRFPKPIRIGARSVGWVEKEVGDWVRERINARDAQMNRGAK
jgi:prophage regulatory protein